MEYGSLMNMGGLSLPSVTVMFMVLAENLTGDPVGIVSREGGRGEGVGGGEERRRRRRGGGEVGRKGRTEGRKGRREKKREREKRGR